MKEKQELRNILDRIDRKGYPAYKELKGVYKFDEYIFVIEHVQGDPFAAPSRVKIEVADKIAGFPRDLYEMKCKKIALQDYLLREFGRQIEHYSFKARGSGKSGLMAISRPGQEVLERSACEINDRDGSIIVRMEIGLPANGRTINAGELIKILFEYIPEAVHRSLRYQSLDQDKIEKAVGLAMNQDFIRKELKRRSLVAFIANGSILPRESGVSGKPMKNAIAWVSPKSLEVTMELPFGRAVTGTAIPEGVTLIVGGGYHGKSTLLEALELGVYNHIAGDGREYVITDDKAMKIRAEDGRSIQHVDISMFIRNLPNGKNTKVFCTEDASGSTSQAANVVEAMEAGSQVLLIDEDTSATNFMIRDELMQRVVHKEKEPIIPYIDRIRELYEKDGVSTILVAGSSGAYFMKADLIIQMDHYTAYEITQYAKGEAVKYTREAGVNGTTGEIYLNPTETEKEELKQRKEKQKQEKQELEKYKNQKAITKDGHQVELLANIGREQDIPIILENTAEGVGLLRSEFLYMDAKDFVIAF